MVDDFKKVGKKSFFDVFNRQMADIAMKFSKLHKPFDEPCARLEFRDKLEAAERECERRFGFLKEDIKVEIGDLDKYGDADRFELEEDQEDLVDKVIEGSRTQVIIGHTLSYRCKKRGHGISVFIPIKQYQEMKEKKVEKPIIKKGNK